MDRYRYKKGFKQKPRATISEVSEEKIVLIVNMIDYYKWLEDKLDARTIEKIKRVNSREGFEAYMEDLKLEFVFPRGIPEPSEQLTFKF